MHCLALPCLAWSRLSSISRAICCLREGPKKGQKEGLRHHVKGADSGTCPPVSQLVPENRYLYESIFGSFSTLTQTRSCFCSVCNSNSPVQSVQSVQCCAFCTAPFAQLLFRAAERTESSLDPSHPKLGHNCTSTSAGEFRGFFLGKSTDDVQLKQSS